MSAAVKVTIGRATFLALFIAATASSQAPGETPFMTARLHLRRDAYGFGILEPRWNCASCTLPISVSQPEGLSIC